jgi:hypothetical protein
MAKTNGRKVGANLHGFDVETVAATEASEVIDKRPTESLDEIRDLTRSRVTSGS